MPQTTIDADKLRSFKYLMNKIEDKHPIFKDKPRCALLIGAGCSYKAKVPLGSGIIDICQKLNFLKNETTGTTGLIKKFYETGDVDLLNAYLDSNQLQSDLQLYIGNKKKVLWQKVEEDRAIEEKKLQEFLGQVVWDDYISCVMEDAAYGFWMDEFDNDPKERQRLIEALIDKKEPSGAYILLSYLIDRGVFNNILTTNFDDFINDALMYYTETKCRFYADDELSQYISIYSNKPNIIKLHGDYRFVNIRNTGDETMRLSRNLEIKMSELLQNFSIIVIGYNGADHSIMNALSHIKRVHNYELIWCGLDPEKVHWRVSHLINNTDNSFFVKIEGFDELIGQLYPHFSKESKPQNLIAKAEVRQKQVDAILQVYKQDFMNSAVSDDEKKEFSRSKEIDDKFNQALQEKDIDKKIELYNEVLKLDEKNNAVYNNLGIVWLEKKEYAKAIDYFDKAIAIKPDDAELLRNRGIAWHFSEQYDKAIEEYAKAINLNPQMALAYESRGVSLHASKRYENAIEDYGRAIAINPNIGSFYRNRAVSWIALDDVEKSLADNLKALELMPDDLIALNNLAYCYRAIGQLDTARQTAEAALLKFPQNPSLFTTLAEVYAQQGKEEDFYVTIQQALELGAPVWTLLEDEAYAPYKTSQRFVMLLDKYRPKP